MILIIVALVLLIIVWYISTLNRLNQTIIKIEEADSGIDVALTKRYDVLMKMIDTVKGYAKHEKETLFEVINLRSEMTLSEKNKVNHKMDENFEKINLLIENYPELRASENVQMLQQSIIEVEEHLQAARRMYNSNVSTFNQMVVTFPTSIVASLSSKKKKEFFEAEESKKQDIKIGL